MSERSFRKRKLLNKRDKANIIFAVLVAISAVIIYVLSVSDDRAQRYKAEVQNGNTAVHFIDVGQGDSTLVISQDKVMLIDTGDRDKMDKVVNYLKKQDVERIDYFVITHPHADHIGEADQIISQFDIGTVIMPRLPDELVPTSATYDALLDAMEDKHLKFRAGRDESFELGGCKAEIFAPHGEYSNINNYSLLVKITHGDNSFLITGDCEKEEEKEFLERGCDISADVLKAAHHGSDTSSTQQWLDRVDPYYAVISCGLDNKYGHPDDDTVKRLENTAEKVWITAEDGGVVFVSDGKGLKAEREND